MLTAAVLPARFCRFTVWVETIRRRGEDVRAGEFDRVVVGISGNLGNLAALHAAVDEARRLDAPLVAVAAWAPPGGETGYRRAPWKPILDLAREKAATTIAAAFRDAFGGPPDDVIVTLTLVRGAPGPSLLQVAQSAGDLLVVGTGRQGAMARLRHGRVTRYCLAHASCRVLVVPPPDLITALRPRHFHRLSAPAA
jgi:nucleotide-binding universal stress UspA family protein